MKTVIILFVFILGARPENYFKVNCWNFHCFVEKTYEAGTKGRQIPYEKEAQGFCDLSLE